MPLTLLKSEYTLTGSPIATSANPNTTEPASSKVFYSPLLAAGVPQLYAAAYDGTPNYSVTLWWWDDASDKWFSFPAALVINTLTQLVFSSYTIAPNAKLFPQVTYADGTTTKIIFGFGLGIIQV